MMNTGSQEFEVGENVTDEIVDYRQSRSSGIVVSVRLAPEDSTKLIILAEESGKTVSQIARQAIRSFISRAIQPPRFAPEITGNMPGIDITAFVPLGPRTVKDAEVTETDSTLPPPASRTGRSLVAA